jgi:hypothetical protein
MGDLFPDLDLNFLRMARGSIPSVSLGGWYRREAQGLCFPTHA